MTNAQFKKKMEVHGDDIYGDTCYKLRLEIIRKIVNCKAIPEYDRFILVDQYIKGLVSNNVVIEAIRLFNKK